MVGRSAPPATRARLGGDVLLLQALLLQALQALQALPEDQVLQRVRHVVVVRALA